jgi:uncharacterized repeat protein (TIGR02543 family)
MTSAWVRAGLLFSTLLLLGCEPPATAAVPRTWALSVAKAGDGSGEISSEPAHVLFCGPACFTNVERGSTVTLHAEPDPGSTFEGWFDGCSGTTPCTLTINADTQVNALFRAKFSPVTVTLVGTGEGRVVSDTPGIDCGSTCTASFRHAVSVTLQPSSSVDSFFSHWTGGGCSTGTCRVSPEDMPTVQAHFTRL